ncbi:hypothetical protein B5D80_03375 [Micromonospora wenchangensis]|uniref:JAB domain-containing protein n=1 Tax=Micromonospora wenchangensis TaxID=1185415 RepID=A0A246RS51_9ACTN|nr:DUF5825 family protein [Micromonospora wenchangensis]OWV11963.1 hypothetical protein B5D80_03375 [Micromonospora wenchangensis]
MSTSLTIDDLRAPGGPAPAGGRPATLTLDPAELPTSGEFAELLTRVPVGGVRLAEPVDLSALPDRTAARIVALLRECSSIGVPVTWSLVLDAERRHLVRHLDHLPAPVRATVRGSGTTAVDSWRSTRTFGLLHFRRGPGFLAVVDQRQRPVRRLVLDDPTRIDVFLRALPGCPWAELTAGPAEAAAARRLVDDGLLLRLGDHCVTLPVHMRSWPLGAALLGGTLASAGKKRDDAPDPADADPVPGGPGDLPRVVRFAPAAARRFVADAVREYRRCLDSRDADGVPHHPPRASALLFGQVDDAALTVTDIEFVPNVRGRDESVIAEFEERIAPRFGEVYRDTERGFWCADEGVLRAIKQHSVNGRELLGSVHSHPNWHEIGPPHERGQRLSEQPTGMDEYLFRQSGWPVNVIWYVRASGDRLIHRVAGWRPGPQGCEPLDVRLPSALRTEIEIEFPP